MFGFTGYYKDTATQMEELLYLLSHDTKFHSDILIVQRFLSKPS